MSIFSKHKPDQEQEVPTLLSKGCTIEGCVRSSVLVRIEGNVKGDVFTESLIIGENGFIEGNIETKDLIVFGAIHGNIKADSLDIRSPGKIYGEINTNNLQVERGAVYNGVLSMEPVKQLAHNAPKEKPLHQDYELIPESVK